MPDSNGIDPPFVSLMQRLFTQQPAIIDRLKSIYAPHSDISQRAKGETTSDAPDPNLRQSASKPYPSSQEGEEDEKAGMGYGSGYEMLLTPEARSIDPTKIKARNEDQFYDRLAKAQATPNPGAADIYRRAMVAANRSAIAGLGYDPHKIAVDTGGKTTKDYGDYDNKADISLMTTEDPSTAVHESIHRGLEELRKAKVLTPEERKFIDKGDNDEYVVRYLMYHTMGDTETAPPGTKKLTPGLKEHEEGVRMFTTGPDALKNRQILDGIEKKAAALIAQRRQYGPR